MTTWVLYVTLIIVAYIGISLFGKLTAGTADGIWNTTKSVFAPLPFLIIVVSNIIFAVGLDYGFNATNGALSIALALGVVTSFVFSVFVFGLDITVTKALGILFVLAGIYLLR